MRRAAKVDRTQAAIVEALKADGCRVQSLREGDGVPDLLVKAPGGRLVLLEVKAKGGQLTPKQVAWQAAWGGDVAVVRTAEAALEVCCGAA